MFRGGSKQGLCCFRLKMGGFLHPWTRCGRTLFPVYVYLLVSSRIYCKGMLTAMTIKLINIFSSHRTIVKEFNVFFSKSL